MPEYLWTGTDAAGKKLSRRVGAATAEEARQILEAEGCSALELHTDEISLALKNSFDDPDVEFEEFDAEEEIKMRQNSGRYLPTLFRTLRGWAIIYLAIGCYIGLHRYHKAPWSYGDTTALFFAIALTILCVYWTLTSYIYKKLTYVREWHRWDDVLKTVRQAEFIGSMTGIKVPAHELARNRALALAGKGKLDEGLQIFAPFANDAKLPHWLYLAHLAAIYDTAKCHDQAIATTLQAIQECPKQDGSLYIDLAFRLIFRKRDVANARQTLERAEQFELPAIAKLFVLRTRGAIAVEENKPNEARNYLRDALEAAKPFGDALLMGGNIRLTKALLCIAEGQAGNRSQAKTLLQHVAPYLKAVHEDELLNRCQQAAR